MQKKQRRSRSAFAAIGATALAGAMVWGGATSASAVDQDAFADTVTVDAIMERLADLQAIADAPGNGGNRSAGSPGYEASGQYVEAVLAEAGYTTSRQVFDVTTQTIESQSVTVGGEILTPEQAIPMAYTPGTTPITFDAIVPAVSTGCTADDWAGVDATDRIAVVSRGVCSFAEKSVAAAGAGARALLVYNSEPGPLNGTFGEVVDGTVPSFGIEADRGAALVTAIGAGAVSISVALEQTTATVSTFNVIAETATGRADNVVMLGSHLDSVPEGPGINDNGSGSATLLEVAVQLAKQGELNNKVRFAWWGAEELGLVGSTHYVDDLVENDPAALDRIATYLNFDMVGSPNYIIGTYDADESSVPANVEIPAGSIETEDVFENYFTSIGQPFVGTSFDGRSDYQAFIDNGIPASGLFTGADDVKTEEEAALFGGIVGETLDQNYHQAGDNLENINEEALGIMSKAIAFATASLANDTVLINGVAAPTPVEETPVAPAAAPQPALAATGSADAGPLLAVSSLTLLVGATMIGLRARRRYSSTAPKS
ncbi:PA domain-containing protein [Agreia bicolorata]|uniref:PA domain-containing protein n=1 Tax=Agreia bicolorata TaxID=110935 RepID=A0A1T4YCN5_9MICO|nr:M20/M25/M40 family metallo-hydrolase [Agreia bicolorata]SKA99061.1 PA domain-containing protein [Agreia bicolorata]